MSWLAAHYVEGHEEDGKLSDWQVVVNGSKSNCVPLINRAPQGGSWDQQCSASLKLAQVIALSASAAPGSCVTQQEELCILRKE